MNPQIVNWSQFAWDAAGLVATQVSDARGNTYNGARSSSQEAPEGALAWAAFKFVDPAASGGVSSSVQLLDRATLTFSITGTSSYDLANGGQLYAYALDATGAIMGGYTVNAVNPPDGQGATTTYIQPTGFLPKTSGTMILGDHPTSPEMLGTGVYGLLLATPVRADTVIEYGEQLLFQVAVQGQSPFTDSYYVEKRVDIVDRYTAATRPQIVEAGNYLGSNGQPLGNSHTTVPSAVVALLNHAGIVATSNIASTSPGSAGIQVPVPALPTAPNSTGLAGAAPLEGQWAVAKFSFVDSASGNLVQTGGVFGLEYPTDLRVGYQGGSSGDYVQGSFQVFATNAEGAVIGGTALAVNGSKVTLPATATDVVLAVRTAQDTQTEHNEQIVFQVNKVDADAFTASHHVEQRMLIQDFKNTFNVAGAHTYSATPTADEFVVPAVASHVSNGSANQYATIEGYGVGDNLKVDISALNTPWPHAAVTATVDVTYPHLSVQNFGTLNLTESGLVLGLRSLNGVDCIPSALYLIGARDNANASIVHTFVLIDSNSDGYLTTNSTTHADVFIKLAGVRPTTFDDTDFVLF